MRRPSPILRAPLLVLILALLQATQLACSPANNEAQETTSAAESAVANDGIAATAEPTPEVDARITAENLFENEKSWPNIAALVEPWTPTGSSEPLKKGYRGGVIRVLEEARVRIDFGRHGEHDIPIAATDVVLRANEVEAGTRHKVAPNFLAHFGTQFVHPTTAVLNPFPTPELAKSDRFLCVFADPTPPEFAQLAGQLADLSDVPKLQGLFFPLALAQDQVQAVKDRLQEVGWPVPFAYPQAAEKLAESLLGEVPMVPTVLLVTSEGRVLHRSTLTEPGALESLRASMTPPSP